MKNLTEIWYSTLLFFISHHFTHTLLESSQVRDKYFSIEYNSYIGQAIAVQALGPLIYIRA